jgi:rhodanese-related sulfurtransferase
MSSVISPLELRDSLGRGVPFQLVDVRSASEFASGHVPGAINIPMEQVETRIDDLAHNEKIVLICQGGKRAAITAGWLTGRRDAVVLEGGTQAWKDAGMPVVECVACRWSLERQVRFGAGVMIVTGAVLALAVSSKWALLPLFVGLGLMIAGLTDFCPMGILLARMPWNRAVKQGVPHPAQTTGCCS